MSEMTDYDEIQPIVRTCQIIVGALIMGVVFFLIIVLVAVPPLLNAAPAVGEGAAAAPGVAPPNDPQLPLITYIAVAVCLLELILAFVIPPTTVNRSRGQIAHAGSDKTRGDVAAEAKKSEPASDTAKLAALYQNQLIIGSALLEGGAFFAGVAYMVERRPIALAAAILLLVVLALRLPTADRIHSWIDRQLALLKEQRQAAL
jgi:hypothetical protein